MLFCLQQLLVVDIPAEYLFLFGLQLLQEQIFLIFVDGFEELAGVVRVVGDQQVEKGRELHCFYLVNVVNIGLYDGYRLLVAAFYALESHPVLRVKVSVVGVGLKLLEVEGGYLQVSVEALGNAGHLRVAVPVELFARRHYHEKQSEFLGLMYRKSHNRMRYLQVGQHLVDLRHAQPVDLLGKQLKIIIAEEALAAKIRVFLCNLKSSLQKGFYVGL